MNAPPEVLGRVSFAELGPSPRRLGQLASHNELQ